MTPAMFFSGLDDKRADPHMTSALRLSVDGVPALLRWNVYILVADNQGGITCGAIDEPRKSSKAIDERVIINFRDKNVVIARFRDKNVYR